LYRRLGGVQIASRRALRRERRATTARRRSLEWVSSRIYMTVAITQHGAQTYLRVGAWIDRAVVGDDGRLGNSMVLCCGVLMAFLFWLSVGSSSSSCSSLFIRRRRTQWTVFYYFVVL